MMPKLVWYISNIITLSRHGCIGFISKNDQYLDYVQCLMASKSVDQMAWMATKVFATIFTRFKSYRKNLAYNESTLVQ
ncbi:MAG: hypothetical protein ACQ9MH_23525 [Nitrospinales bacterium]